MHATEACAVRLSSNEAHVWASGRWREAHKLELRSADQPPRDSPSSPRACMQAHGHQDIVTRSR